MMRSITFSKPQWMEGTSAVPSSHTVPCIPSAKINVAFCHASQPERYLGATRPSLRPFFSPCLQGCFVTVFHLPTLPSFFYEGRLSSGAEKCTYISNNHFLAYTSFKISHKCHVLSVRTLAALSSISKAGHYLSGHSLAGAQANSDCLSGAIILHQEQTCCVVEYAIV